MIANVGPSNVSHEVASKQPKQWCDLLRARFSFEFGENTLMTAVGRMGKIAGQIGFSDEESLFDAIKTRRLGRCQREAFLHQIFNHETRFMRHADLYASLAKTLSKKSPPHILAVGCSYGHEVYSIASCLEVEGVNDFQVDGVDLSEDCLRVARKGEYEVGDHLTPPGFVLSNGIAKAPGRWKEKVSFRYHNIMNSVASIPTYDAVICTNVMVYYEPDSRVKMFDALVSATKDLGYLSVNLYMPNREQLGILDEAQHLETGTVYKVNRL